MAPAASVASQAREAGARRLRAQKMNPGESPKAGVGVQGGRVGYMPAMAAIIAVLLVLLPFGLYLLWRRLGPAGGEPSSGIVLSLLLGVGLMLGAAVWFGLSRSMEPGTSYAPAVLGPDGQVQPQVQRR
mgnify:CR=1 FL=1